MQRKQFIWKIVCVMIFMIGVMSVGSNTANAVQKQDEISVVIDGETVNLSKHPVTINNVNFVPLRGVFEKLGVSIHWDQSSATVKASKGAQTMEYTIGNSYARINNIEQNMSSPGRIIEGTVMIPLRFVGEAFGAEVVWSTKTKTIRITSDMKLLSSISSEPTGNTASNLMNNGFAAQQGKWIYGLDNELNGNATGGNGGYLYKVNKDSGEKISLMSSQVRMLNIQGDWLYFLGIDGIYKLKTDGSALTQLTEYAYSTQLFVMNNWLFYNAEDGIYRLQIDRVGAVPIRVMDNSNISRFTISGGWIYYQEHRESEVAGMLGRIRINGVDNVSYGRLDYEDFTVHENYIYFNYLDGYTNKVGRMSIEGGELQYLQTAEGYNISDNKLFFGKGTLIYQSEMDGSGSRPLADLEGWSMPLKFTLLDGSLFYEKGLFNEDKKYVSVMYSVNLAAKSGKSLFGKVLPAEDDSSYRSSLSPFNDKERAKEVEQAAKAVVAQKILPDMTTREKIKALHDYVVLNTAYDYENYVNDTIPEVSYTVYGVLMQHKAVCQGYALTMKILLDLINVENYLITGTVNGNGHEWNIIVLDGVYYHLDATWDDPTHDTPGTVRYDYFLILDEKMAQDHVFDREGIKEALQRFKIIDEVKVDFK
ncbi:hypothetical protein D3C76_221480 [compost metagenome]